MNPIEQGILRTLIYFDLFEYPLTTEQLWRWYFPVDGKPVERAAFDQTLNQLKANGRISQTQNFWHRSGREAIVEQRLRRTEENKKKWAIAQRGARWLALVPWVRLVAVCNTVAINNARPESDIDLLIVTAPGRLWLTRLWCVAVMQFWGLRRHGTKIANRLCLSFFVSDQALDFRPLTLKPQDEYFLFWIDQLVPLRDMGGYATRLQQANAWVKDFLPNVFSDTRQLPPHTSWYRKVKEDLLSGRIGDWWERSAQRTQLAKMQLAPIAAASGASVMTNDVLKFHEQDRRQQYNERFRRAIADLQ